MPRKRGLAYLLPFEDPDFVPEHPAHHQQPIPEDPYAPLRKREKRKLENAQLERDLRTWEPPHVIRSWEVSKHRSHRYHEVMQMKLSWGDFDSEGKPTALLTAREEFERRNSPNDSSATRRGRSPYNPDFDPDHDDFRQFAVQTLHLGYHRFHPSTVPFEGEDHDPSDLPEDQICWVMEYSEHECSTIRRQIAHIIGLYPAVTDPDTESYDDDIAFRYERRMQARCLRGHKRCIRPSHIRTYTPGGVLIP